MLIVFIAGKSLCEDVRGIFIRIHIDHIECPLLDMISNEMTADVDMLRSCVELTDFGVGECDSTLIVVVESDRSR